MSDLVKCYVQMNKFQILVKMNLKRTNFWVRMKAASLVSFVQLFWSEKFHVRRNHKNPEIISLNVDTDSMNARNERGKPKQ